MLTSRTVSNPSWIALLCLVALALGCASQPDSQVDHLRQYLAANYQTPEDYLVSCFADHDIVFVGEYHRIRHDAKLIQNMVPRLYHVGVYNIGIEFANYEDQSLIDQLINADTYNDSLANAIQFRQWPFWGFQEYVDIYRAAWNLNQTLPPDAPKFRVVGLNSKYDWSYVWTEEDRKDPEVMKKVFAQGDSDEIMADVISKEFIANGLKALVYSGINHAYTKYEQPIYDVENDSLIRLNDQRMGNRVYHEIGERCMTVFLHSPWPSTVGYSESVRPADGVIDSVFEKVDSTHVRCGFAVAGTPFGALTDSTGYWHHGYPGFTLADYCDGYIYQMPLGEYQGCTVIPNFINQSNRKEAAAQNANPATKDSLESVESLMAGMYDDTDFGRRFAEFK